MIIKAVVADVNTSGSIEVSAIFYIIYFIGEIGMVSLVRFLIPFVGMRVFPFLDSAEGFFKGFLGFDYFFVKI